MIVTNASLQALRVGYSAAFRAGMSKAPSQWKDVATLVSSTSRGNTYDWLGQFPKLREWVGDRVLKDISENAYTLMNKTYEATVNVPRSALEDDTFGTYNARFEEMGYAAATHPDELVFGLLKRGQAEACFDGKPFFSADHEVAENVDGTGTKTKVSNLLAPAVAENAETPWYLLDTSRPLKPLIFQERTKPELTAITNPDNDTVFNRDSYPHGIRYRCNAGFGFWQMAVKSTLALTPASFGEALKTLQAVKTDGGRPLGLGRGGKSGLMLVVPTELNAAGLKVLTTRRLSGDEDNIWFDAATLINSPWLD